MIKKEKISKDNILKFPSNFKTKKKFRKTGKAGIFAGSLELVKEGNIKIKQDKLFDDVYIRESK